MDSTVAAVVNSTSSGVGGVSAEMIPVNPKEVSPMDVDVASSLTGNNPLFVSTTNSLTSTHVDSKMTSGSGTVTGSAVVGQANTNGTVDLITYNT